MTPAIWHPCKNSPNPNGIGVGQGVQKQTSLTPSRHKFDQKPDNFVKPSRDWVLLKSTYKTGFSVKFGLFSPYRLFPQNKSCKVEYVHPGFAACTHWGPTRAGAGGGSAQRDCIWKAGCPNYESTSQYRFRSSRSRPLINTLSTWAPNWLWWLHTSPYWQDWALIWSCFDQDGSFDDLLFCTQGPGHQNRWIFRFKYDQQWREEGWRRMTKGEERVDKCESAGGRPCSVTLFCHTKSCLCCNSSNCWLNTCSFLERFLWIRSPLELLLRSEFIHIQKRQPWPTRVLKTEPPSECEHCDYHLNGGRG